MIVELPLHPRRMGSFKRDKAFTLIELLAVMAIILVLAGLILSIAGSANYNAGKSRAMAEIKAMETALESYKADNGAYPENGDTDNLNPVAATSATAPDANPTTTNYIKASNFLWQSLNGISGNTAQGTVSGKAYMTFKPGQLNATTLPVSNSNATNYIVDPFGFSYGYSTANLAEANKAAATTPPGTPASGKGYNPTFDLWSTAGYAPGGRSTPSGTVNSGAALYNTIWIKNW